MKEDARSKWRASMRRLGQMDKQEGALTIADLMNRGIVGSG